MPTQYRIKQRVLRHPFSDGSGTAFYDPTTNVISSINVNIDDLNDILGGHKSLTDEESDVLSQLLSQQLIED
ncbi:hypothetical protein [Agaribacter marinus]|uniref:Uncharacterized protein n=1 Tax=Agaribacter marinus TaxID=1431249 RepID=A0AA37SZP0_9ALTE|nr:hypothetical protein [Agaribacter marinus]GLR70916.1 hypothetical protein GCM10007852_18240 [Agaribacter marinus]